MFKLKENKIGVNSRVVISSFSKATGHVEKEKFGYIVWLWSLAWVMQLVL